MTSPTAPTKATVRTVEHDVADYLRELNATLDRCLCERDMVSIELLTATDADKRQLRTNRMRITQDINVAVASIKAVRKIFGIATTTNRNTNRNK